MYVFYAFTFLLSELVINTQISMRWGADYVIGTYSCGILCTGLGYLLFGLFSIKDMEVGHRKKVLLACKGLYCALMAIGLLTPINEISLATAFCFALLLLGYVGGFVHFCACCSLQNSQHTGRVIGISMCIATILQYLVQKFAVTVPFLWVAMLIGALNIGYLVWKQPDNWAFENLLPYNASPEECPRPAWVALIIVSLISLSLGFNDSVVTDYDAKGILVLSEWPRLFYAIGLLVAGTIADILKRKYLAISTLSAYLLSFLAVGFLGPTGNMNASMSFMYCYCGFYVIYLTVSFLDIAPKTRHPVLWAGMGRTVRSIVTAMTILPAMTFFEKCGLEGILVANTIAVIGVAFVIWYSENRDYMERFEQLKTELTAKRSEKVNKFEEFVSKFSMTPRETEVLQIVLTTSATTKEIAAQLSISERVCQRYLTSIYEKTGTSSRIDLMLSYYGKKLELPATKSNDDSQDSTSSVEVV